jgi:parvulin-like peptidyl-prolyl isomerase
LAKKKEVKAPREMTRRQISHHRQQERRQRFIFIVGVVIIAAIILVVAAGWVTSEYIPLHRTVITVNDTKYTAADYIGYLELVAVNQQKSGQQQQASLFQLASSAVEQMPKDELTRQAAELLGITVSDQEAADILKGANLPVNTGSIAFMRAALLRNKIKSDYFGVQVPQSDNQVWSNIMLLESDIEAAQIRGRLEAGDNFTTLAPEYALNYYSKNMNKGDFGWHPLEVLQDQLGSDVPLNYAFNAEIGTLSQPLFDQEMYKQRGYWLIKPLEPPSENQTNVDALLVSSQVLAADVKGLLENTDNISAIADQYTQYSLSKEKHGQMGVVNKANMTPEFNGYVFSDNVVVGKWSQPIVDNGLWTQGGAWLVRVLDRAENKTISAEDRDYLINKRFDKWLTDLTTSSTGAINTDGLTNEVQEWAIDRVTKFMEGYQG